LAIAPHKNLKTSSGTRAGCNDLIAAQDIPIIKNSDVRVRKRTEAPALVSHILVGRVRGGYPQQHPTTVEVGEWFSTPFMRAACLGSSGTQIGLLLITVSLERMKSP
jgi:hypothetical protein